LLGLEGALRLRSGQAYSGIYASEHPCSKTRSRRIGPTPPRWRRHYPRADCRGLAGAGRRQRQPGAARPPRQSPLGPPDKPLTLDAGGLSVRVGLEPGYWRPADSLPLRLAGLDAADSIRLETSREQLTLAPLVRPRGANGASGLQRERPLSRIEVLTHDPLFHPQLQNWRPLAAVTHRIYPHFIQNRRYQCVRMDLFHALKSTDPHNHLLSA